MSTPWTYDHEDVDLAGDLVPADFRRPGMFQAWQRAFRVLATAGFLAFCGWIAICVVVRIFT